MKKIEIVILAVILIGAFMVRLYRFNSPVADWHSWRQADTSSVSRNFVKYGFDLLHPRMNNISNVQSGLENPQGYFFAELPIYNFLQAGSFVLFDYFTIEEWGRLISIISSLVGMVFVYLLVRRYAGVVASMSAVFFYAFLPFAIYYGRVILPDSLGNAMLLGGIYFFDKSIDKIRGRQHETKDARKDGAEVWNYFLLTVSVCLTAVSLLVRPHLIFYALVFVYLAWETWRFDMFRKWQLYMYVLFSLAPFILWRMWISQYPEGIPASGWLFNQGNIRFSGAFFYWLFAERLVKLILGYWGLIFLVLGLLRKNRRFGFFATFFASSLVYVIVIARGNVQHDYYQYITIPSIVMLLGLGVDFLTGINANMINKKIAYIVCVVATVFTFAFGWYYVKDYFNVNNPSMIVAGEAVDRLTPKNSKILAPLDGDSSFLYQTNRQGWASFEHSLPAMIKLGADYLVLLNPRSQDYVIGKTYKIVASTPEYILFNLKEKP